MSKFFKFLAFSLFIFSNIAFADSANITKIVFTTSAQTISPSTPSDTITIQTQNSSDSSEKISETNDLYLSTTPAGGEFSSNQTTWNPVDKITMSTNTSNKNLHQTK